jgi:hypothetical protein
MKLIEYFPSLDKEGYLDDPIYHLNLKRFEETSDDYYLMVGDFYSTPRINQEFDKPLVILTLEEPNFCTRDWKVNPITGENVLVGQHADDFNKAQKVLTLCPYTANSIDNRVPIFFPYNEEYLQTNFTKEFDIIYSGHYHSPLLLNLIKTLYDNNIDYRVINSSNDQYTTNSNCSYLEKIELYSKSKMTLCHNLLFVHPQNVPRYKQFLNAEKNLAFAYLDHGLMPQIKSRVFEAAFNKSLILCLKDPWNIIEMFFEPDKEFIYFENEFDLLEKISYIKENYIEFEPIIENAYQKAINNYTTQHFYKNYLKKIKI